MEEKALKDLHPLYRALCNEDEGGDPDAEYAAKEMQWRDYVEDR